MAGVTRCTFVELAAVLNFTSNLMDDMGLLTKQVVVQLELIEVTSSLNVSVSFIIYLTPDTTEAHARCDPQNIIRETVMDGKQVNSRAESCKP